MRSAFLPGIDVLLSRHRDWLKGARVGLVSHAAAADREGCTTAERLWRHPDVSLTCLFAPEHGYFGRAGAGALCRSQRHPDWRIPVYSLYGSQRSPTSRMLRSIDILVVDLQDIGSRCYTYVSTLFNVLEAAAAASKPVVVLDRPVPLPDVVDGPVMDERWRSFVAHVRAPLAYGMTPAEAARWMVRAYGLEVDLRVAPMRGYHRDAGRRSDWGPWLPPSPGMRSWESAMCFPATVIFEAFPHMDHGRATNLPFQVFGAPWLDGTAVVEGLDGLRLPGVRFHAHPYDPRPWTAPGAILRGVRLTVTDPARFRPACTAVAMMEVLLAMYGPLRLFRPGAFRAEWFDKLMGTDAVRVALEAGESAATIAATWRSGLRQFGRERRDALLYRSLGTRA
jgi:uncharacterized protein YbbC (DUF1343 family)